MAASRKRPSRAKPKTSSTPRVREWSGEEVERLRVMHADGATYVAMGLALGRTDKAVKSACVRLLDADVARRHGSDPGFGSRSVLACARHLRDLESQEGRWPSVVERRRPAPHHP